MNIAAHHSMIGGKRLPYDAEVEYLETASTSNAKTYVDTGVAPSDDFGFVVDFMCTKLNRANHLVGSMDGSSTGRFSLFVRTTNSDTEQMAVYWGGVADNTNDGHAWYMRRATVGVNWMNSRISEIDGVYLSELPHATSGSAQNAYLMGYNSNGSATVSSGVRFYSAKFSIGSTLVRDFIPVRKGTVGYLYDRVSGALFGNAGTGAFIVGPDAPAMTGGGISAHA